MKAKLFLVFILALLAYFVLWLVPAWKKQVPPLPKSKAEGASFFVPIQVVGFTNNSLPCVRVQIEKNELLLVLDLGCNNAVGLSEDYLEKIQKKSFVESVKSAGFRGTVYEIKRYKIPSLGMGVLNFHPVFLVEENKFLWAEGRIGEQKKESIGPIAGRLGWKIFENTGLLLDFRKQMMIVCDSAETLEEQGYSLRGFTKVPIRNERDLIEVDVISSRGPLRCILDTGSTYNHLHTVNRRNQSFEKMISKKRKVSSFVMDGEDFGPIVFRKLPMQLPFHVDALLGMEFLLTHVVFIDFVKNEIYFAK